jgi:glycerol-3-phosphate dehydrogenase
VNAALYAPRAGVISPYEAAIAFAESAAINSVRFALETTVTDVRESTPTGGFIVNCVKNGASTKLHTRIVINAAGVESGTVANFLRGSVSVPPIIIHPQRGQYYLLDNTQRELISRTIFQLPTHMGKGVLIAPTVDGNILLGPTAEAVEDPQHPGDPAASATTHIGLQEALQKARLTLAHVPIHERITAFAGVRAKHAGGDFLLEESPAGFIHDIGIDSTGLTAAPAIAQELAQLALVRLEPKVNYSFEKKRPGIVKWRDCPPIKQSHLIAENPTYGNIICRCETITQAEIMEAMNRFIQLQTGVQSPSNLDALKRRTRAQMGRCQGGFCTNRLVELIAHEHEICEKDVTKNGVGTQMGL